MLIIAHRGNISGINPSLENNPNYIQNAIDKNFQVEIDLWFIEDLLWLGHDEPQYKINFEWLNTRRNVLWIHPKNFLALDFLTSRKENFKYFWHTCDEYVLVSTNHIWAHNLDVLIKPDNCIVPLLDKKSLQANFSKKYYAICTDFSELCQKLTDEN